MVLKTIFILSNDRLPCIPYVIELYLLGLLTVFRVHPTSFSLLPHLNAPFLLKCYIASYSYFYYDEFIFVEITSKKWRMVKMIAARLYIYFPTGKYLINPFCYFV